MLRVIFISLLLIAGSSWAESGDEEQTAKYRVLAEQGDSNAQTMLGAMYYSGRGVIQDYKEAEKWWRLAAEQGDSDAQHNLGVMYADGQGVIQDYKEAEKWWRLAAEQGYSKSQSNLGAMYANGHGLLQDYKLAHMWWSIAATDGDENASKNREIIAKLMSSEDVSKAQDMAREWMKAHQ